MPRTPYDWSHGPAVIDPHSLAKHTILREYVERYVSILTHRGNIPNLRITLVDGFAGGGEYVVKGQGDKIHPGSPLILMDAVRVATARINVGRTKPVEVDADFIFVEKDKTAFEHLKAALPRHVGKGFMERRVRLLHGSFEEHLPTIVKEIRSKPGRKSNPIFVLDQYGYTLVPVGMLRQIMGPFDKAEVFLTIAVDHLSAYAPTLEEARSRVLSAMKLPHQAANLLAGAVDFEEVEQLEPEHRATIMRSVQQMFHETFATQSGARCYTPFFITSRGSHRSYWFLHLSHNSRANDEVKNLHWGLSNSFQHHGRPGTSMLTLGFDPSKTSSQLSFNFDASARDRTVDALIQELPRLMLDKYRGGISLKDLYANICSETPATKEILGDALNELCTVGVLDKQGSSGEARELTTKLQDKDIVSPSSSGRLFSIAELRAPTRRRGG